MKAFAYGMIEQSVPNKYDGETPRVQKGIIL